MSQNNLFTLQVLNDLTEENAEKWFSHCCAAPKWFKAMSAARPYLSKEHLFDKAKDIWQDCNNNDFQTAFEAHPMIGDVNSLREKYASTKAMASNEQQGTSEADEATLQTLADSNHQYLARHGFIFIICATGLSAKTMLDALNLRINNETQTEIQLAAAEQLKITLLRLDKGIQSL